MLKIRNSVRTFWEYSKVMVFCVKKKYSSVENWLGKEKNNRKVCGQQIEDNKFSQEQKEI